MNEKRKKSSHKTWLLASFEDFLCWRFHFLLAVEFHCFAILGLSYLELWRFHFWNIFWLKATTVSLLEISVHDGVTIWGIWISGAHNSFTFPLLEVVFSTHFTFFVSLSIHLDWCVLCVCVVCVCCVCVVCVCLVCVLCVCTCVYVCVSASDKREKARGGAPHSGFPVAITQGNSFVFAPQRQTPQINLRLKQIQLRKGVQKLDFKYLVPLFRSLGAAGKACDSHYSGISVSAAARVRCVYSISVRARGVCVSVSTRACVCVCIC